MVPLLDLWKGDAQFSKLDEQGIPIHDAEGNPIAKSLRKKLEKQFSAQQTLRDKYFK